MSRSSGCSIILYDRTVGSRMETGGKEEKKRKKRRIWF